MSAEASRFYDGHEISNLGRRFIVRRLTREHAEGLIRFDKGLSDESRRLFTPHAYDPATVDDYVERSNADADVSYVLLSDDQEIVAYFFLWEADLEVPLLGIGIADRFQNLGLGTRLMEILIDTARRMERHGIDLTTMQDNDRAFHVYERCGFRYVGDVPNLTGDGRTVVERRLFLPLVKDARVPDRSFGPPDIVSH
jgi:ribosomal protein S18 acetylase RimI-like enzyme